jgi:antitoxin ParD1/3/4
MATMNISLPDALKAWVEEQVATGRYGNSSDYIRDLLRRDQERAEAREKFERLVEEGLASGVSELTVDEVFANARRRALAEMKHEA